MTQVFYYVFTLIFFLFDYFILAMGLNIQYGETGILNFAYIGFVAIGAYVTGAVSLPNSVGTGQHYILGLNMPFPFNLLIGGLTASAFAVLVALISLRRLRTDYLAMVLISLSLVLYDICNNFVPLFNGADGLYNVPAPLAGVLHLTTNSFIPVIALLTGVIAMFLWWVMSRITQSPLGRTFRAIRDDETVAAALGKNVFRKQLTSMLIGSFYAGIGGGLIIQFGGSFNPSAWLPGETFVVFAVIIVGGVGNNVGLLMGSLLVETLLVHLPAFLPAIPGHPGLIEYIDAMLIGVLLMVMLWFRPQGVVPERVRKSTVIDKLLLNSNGASAVGESLHDEEATSVSQ
ncbi:MAG: branched-chain amino acid ABC transporter permease [Acidobacteriota bacterium]|nr:branched-chain amino acid ABC transporter permease [Acidobacteriota bacterium]MDE3222494.1 branched-chain amino acid ABC transporter permease [Acidobacteriota bacterium]